MARNINGLTNLPLSHMLDAKKQARVIVPTHNNARAIWDSSDSDRTEDEEAQSLAE